MMLFIPCAMFILYTCQLCQMREIFVSIISEFPKNFRQRPNITEDHWRYPDDFRTLPTIPEDIPRISEGCRMSRCEARNLGAILFACYLGLKRDIWRRSLDYFGWKLDWIFHVYGWWTSSPELWVRREKLSSMREIDVFDPQAWDSRIMRESWQV